MRRFNPSPALLLLLFTLPVRSDTEFQSSIPVDTVEALFNFYHEAKFAIYSDIADEFPDFPVPDGFTIIGSVNQMTQLRVVFEIEAAQDEATQAIIEVFENQEWIQFPSYPAQFQEVGFVSPRQFNPGSFKNLCHDDLGNLTVRSSATESANYLSLGYNLVRNNQQGDCEQQLAMQQQSAGRRSQSNSLRQYLPRMEIPEEQNRGRMVAFVSGGSSISGNTVETDGAMTSEQGIEEIYEYFSDQIQDQGWELDSKVVGSLSANGTWTRSPESNLRLIGRLSILGSAESDYELHFMMTAEGYTGNNSAIFNPIPR